MRDFLTIAITGGIGSGKSEVSSIIKNAGYIVYDADEIYANVIGDENVVFKIYALLRIEPEYYDGKVFFNRKKVSSVIFSDAEKLNALNIFTHALVYEKIKKIIDEHNKTPLFFEIPLLFESGHEKDFDRVIVVTRPKKDRVEAVIKRSGLSYFEVLSRINNQFDYDKNDLSEHTLIVNDGDIPSLEYKVKKALGEIFKGRSN